MPLSRKRGWTGRARRWVRRRGDAQPVRRLRRAQPGRHREGEAYASACSQGPRRVACLSLVLGVEQSAISACPHSQQSDSVHSCACG